MPPANAARLLYAQSIALHIHALREALVRHDELIGAHHLMEYCVPYFLREDPKIIQARKEQYELVRHVLDPTDYAKAYSHTPGEQSFESQFSHLTIATADGVPRIAWLVEQLREAQPNSVVDLGCNDGWMLRHLADRTDMDVRSVRGVDLNINCVERARERFNGDNGGKDVAHRFECGAIEAVQAGDELADVVVCFEVLEHVANPYAIIDAARRLTRPGGLMFFSTPDGAVEQGWLPNWSQPGWRGHVRSFTHGEFAALMEYAATGEHMTHDRDPSGAWTAAVCQDLYCMLLLGKVRR